MFAGGRGGGRGGPAGPRGGFRGGGRGGGGSRAPPTFRDAPIERAVIGNVADYEEKATVAPVTLNVFPFRTGSLKDVFAYELRFFGTYKDGKEIDLADFIRSDFERIRIQNNITQLYDVLFKQYKEVFPQNDVVIHVYDRSKEYYSSVQIPDRVFTIDFADVNPVVVADLRNPSAIVAKIRCVDHLQPSFEPLEPEKKLLVNKYLDALVTQVQYDEYNRFLVYGSKVYDKQNPRTIDSLSLLNGHHKVNNVLDRNRGILQLEPKIMAFYPNTSVLKFSSESLGFTPSDDLCRSPFLERLNGLMKGIVVETNYGATRRRFKVVEVSDVGAEKIPIPEQQLNVASYFANTKKINLVYPQFPCLVEKLGKAKNYYPIELLNVADGQRARRGVFTKKQNADMIKLSQMIPTRFYENMDKEAVKANIGDANPYFKQAGLTVSTKPLPVSGRSLLAPQIQYATTARDLTFGEWRFENNDKFVKGGRIEKLLFVVHKAPIQLLREFATQLVRRGKAAGMDIQSFDCGEMPAFDYVDIATFMEAKMKLGVDFLFVLSDARGLHDNLKAAEQKTKLNTEQVLPKTAERTGGSTFENILMKLNLKVGGINHYLGTSRAELELMKTKFDVHKTSFADTLCIGFQVAHPGARGNIDIGAQHQNEPSVLGYSYTSTGNANVSDGGYLFIRPKQTILDKIQLDKPLTVSLEKYLQWNKTWPKRVLIFRGSVSDADFSRLADYEAIKIGRILRDLQQKHPGSEMPSFAMVAISKQHNTRLLKARENVNPEDKAPQQNVPPGTIIDHTITNEGFEQFYFVAHKALQGIAKPVVATVVIQRGNNLPFKLIQQMTYNLCYHHEIVPLSISVPAPIRSAEQLALRGQKNLLTMGNGSLSGLSDSKDDPEYLNQFYLRLTDTYETKNEHRFWA